MIDKHKKLLTVLISGASGAVGQSIIPDIRRRGYNLVLFGRDVAKLRYLYPDLQSDSYSNLPNAISDCDVFINLAVRNNSACGGKEEFNETNVKLPIKFAEMARGHGVRRFIQLSSTHAFDRSQQSHYAVSKRNASIALRSLTGIGVSEIFSPKIYNSSQGSLHNWVWNILGAVKPTISSQDLALIVNQEIDTDQPGYRSRLVSKEYARTKFYDIYTTSIELLFVAVVVFLFWWLLALMAAAIRLDSRGPIIFRQVRVGRHKKSFVCWKFRTMHVGTAHRATHETSADSITRVGRFLRRTKLDEIPQIVNLLRRELSLVGPRPCLPSQVALIEERDKRGVYSIRPGITGWAQVNRIDMREPAELAIWDEEYCALRSILFDAKILFRTLIGGGSGDRIEVPSSAGAGDNSAAE